MWMPFGPSRPSVAIRMMNNAIKTDSQSSVNLRLAGDFLDSGEGDMFDLIREIAKQKMVYLSKI